jgi:hypothetical protein
MWAADWTIRLTFGSRLIPRYRGCPRSRWIHPTFMILCIDAVVPHSWYPEPQQQQLQPTDRSSTLRMYSPARRRAGGRDVEKPRDFDIRPLHNLILLVKFRKVKVV